MTSKRDAVANKSNEIASEIVERIEKKIEEIGHRVSCFIESKLLKMEKNTDPVDQEYPSFSYHTYSHYYLETNFSSEEAEYLFYLFRSCCVYPKEHMQLPEFRLFFPPGFKEENILLLHSMFQDIQLKRMGLKTISFKSFLFTLSIMIKGTNQEKGEFLTETIFHLYDDCDTCEPCDNLSVEQITKIVHHLCSMKMPNIAPLPVLCRRSPEGIPKYHVCSGISEDDDGESESESEIEYEKIPVEVCYFNNRTITMNRSNADVLPDELTNTIHNYLQQLDENSKENGITRQQLSLLFNALLTDYDFNWGDRCFGPWNYFKNLILETMENDFILGPESGLMLSEKEGFLIKNWEFGVFEKWKMHWCVVREGFFWYYDCDKEVVQLKEPERVICLQRAIIQELEPTVFSIAIPGYTRKFRTETPEELKSWVNVLSSHSGFDEESTPHQSSAPIRHCISSQWFVDGKDTMEAMYIEIMRAKEEIYIADWFLSPSIFLIRELDNKFTLDDDYRLDNVLKHKAENGVKVYILPWNETKVAMDLGTASCAEYLESLHENIRIIRHPIISPIKWSHHQKIVCVDQNIAFVGGIDLCFGRWDEQTHDITDIGDVHKWPGKDYYNPLVCEFERVHEPWDDLVNRQKHPRMPWHDVSIRVDGAIARDIARNFIQRWNHHKEDLSSPANYLLPKSRKPYSCGSHTIQLLRSLGDWSAGLGTIPECSIYNGYIHAIQSARKYIYIENQFFVSSLSNEIVKNQIAQCIVDKIIEAIENKRAFKVIILIPQHPEGPHYEESAASAMIIQQQYRSISRGGNSILEQLKSRYPDINTEDYIGFFTVRNFGKLDDKYIHEQIYVHSKTLIVDDRIAIIGSANINDRSMLGVRDSEIGVKILGGEMIHTKMNNENWKAVKLVHELRESLWREHLGYLNNSEISLSDPINAIDFYWRPIAKKNTEIKYKLFPLIEKEQEDSSVSLIKQETEYVDITPETEEDMNKIQGHLLEFDLEYCGHVDLDIEGLDTIADIFL